jgi:hypothetical protein
MVWNMETDNSAVESSFWERVKMGFRLMFNSEYGRRVIAGLKLIDAADASPIKEPPERLHASGLFLLGMLQREGRLVDFLEQDVAAYSDDEVGAAARVVHAGCGRALKQYFTFEPAVLADEGSTMTIPESFDAGRIRLAGNVTGQPPFKGALKHHGWVAKEIRLPDVPKNLDPRVIAPAEVELP